MSPDIVEELYFFMHSFLLGIMITFVYDLLIIFRKVIKHNNFAVSSEDLLFWIACSISLFAMLYEENNGVPRWFAIAGAGAGMMLYKVTLSRLFIKCMVFILTAILRFLHKVFAVVAKPFLFLSEKAGKLSRRTGRAFCKRSRICKKKLTAWRKMIKMILCKR